MSQIIDHDVLIRVLTAFEKGGIDAAKQAAKELKESMADTSSEGALLNGMLEMMNKDGKSAGNVLAGLSEILKNGTASAGGFVKVINGIAPALGLATGGVSLLIGAISLCIQLWNDHKKAEEEAAEAAQKAAEERAAAIKKHAAELDKIKLDAINGEVKKLKEGLDEVKDAAQKTCDRLSSMEDSQLELEYAMIDNQLANGEITEEEATFRKAQKKSEAAAKKDAREMADLDAEWQRLVDAADKTEEAATAAAEAADQANKELADAKAQLAEASAAKKGLGYIAAGEQQQKINAAKANVAAKTKAAEDADVALAAANAAKEAAADELFGRGADVSVRREVLSNQAQARLYTQQTAETAFTKAAEKRANDEKAAAEAEAQRKAKEKAEKEAEDEKNRLQAFLGRTDHLQAAQGMVRNAADAGFGNGQIVLGGAAGEEAQAKGREAIAAAAQRIQEGENNQQVITDLCATLQKLGTVVSNWTGIVAHLDALDGKLDIVSRQIKNSRS